MSGYTADQRAEAVGLALAVGADRAAESLGIPRRTISFWLGRAENMPAVLASQRQIADKLWEAVQLGVEVVMEGLLDPKARLSDKARALEVLATQHALMTGGATSRSESYTITAEADPFTRLSPQELHQLQQWVETVQAADDSTLADVAAAWRTPEGAEAVEAMTAALLPGSAEAPRVPR